MNFETLNPTETCTDAAHPLANSDVPAPFKIVGKSQTFEARRKRKWLKSIGAKRRRKISRRQSARICANLSDGYVRGIIVRLNGIPSQAVTPAMIAEKRQAIAAKRFRRLMRAIAQNTKHQ